MTDPTTTGRRVLAALDAGRQRAIDRARSRAAPTERRVRAELDREILEARLTWGRAGRISRRTGIARRTVARLLAKLSSVASIPAHHRPNETVKP